MRRHQFETYVNKVFDFSTEVVALLEPVYRTNPKDRAVDYALGTALIREGQVHRGESIVDRILKDRDTAEANLLTGRGTIRRRRLQDRGDDAAQGPGPHFRGARTQ